MNMKTLAKTQSGLTMIEILIALVLGVMLLGGTISMFIANKRIYNEQENMSRLQENARFALEILMRDIRMAGYTGCSNDISNVENHIENAGNDDNLFNFSNAVEGSEDGSNWKPSDSTEAIAAMLPNTDGISIRYLEDTGLEIEPPFMNTNSAALHVNTDNGLSQGMIVGVADCDSADVFSISNANPDGSGTVDHNTGTNDNGPKNATKNLQKKYLGDATIVRFVSRRYIIRNNANGQPALYRYQYDQDIGDSDGDGNTTEFLLTPQELIEGVENMQLLYGVDTSGDRVADTYLDGANVTAAGAWTNVVSVRLALLFRTINENRQIEADTKTYDLLGGSGNGGETVGPVNDHRRRRVFTTTIQIRNRSS